MSPEKNAFTANAQPTKGLFISMLIKDVTLSDAISDLVDNSVDGARLFRPRESFDGLWIRIRATKELFTIEDNCGGITADNARNYAFRFGRADEMKPTPNSIGRFGIGMKRSLFKLGRKFTVESTALDSHFVLEVDVNEWRRKEEGDWHFDFKQFDENQATHPLSKRGTAIAITELDSSVSQNFESPAYINKLIRSLELHHLFSIAKGLQISVNDHFLVSHSPMILQSRQIKPASWRHSFEDKVKVKAYVGLHDHDIDAGGWYVFCNGRLVLGADQTAVTGWGTKELTRIPKYHGQYDRFRGYIFFESVDAERLPWNTTKTSVDADSPKWRFARAEMITLMRPVCDFLNRIHQERQKKDSDGDGDAGPLELAIEAAESVELFKARSTEVFLAPKPKRKAPPPETGHIQYYKTTEEISRVKRVLGVRTLTEVGEKTFEYFLKAECE